jgi:hypothetical protein
MAKKAAALLMGPVLHLAGDRLPLLAGARGPLDAATIGAAASSAPDLEHVVPFLRLGGSKLFHGRRGWHRVGRFRTEMQLLLAGAILGALITPRRRALGSSDTGTVV